MMVDQVMAQVQGHGATASQGKMSGNLGTDLAKGGARPHPQETYSATTIDEDSFYGRLRRIYSEKVLKTQLEQLQKSGAYHAWDLKWQPVYDVNRLHGGKRPPTGNPPSLFWESDLAKWIEGVCYFLNSPDGARSSHASEFKKSMQSIVDQIEKAQHPEGYLNIYFTVVDPEGRFMNVRDLHELYNCGHMLEASLAHYHYTQSKQFLNCMLKYVDYLMKVFGTNPGQKHGYPGHPELELAMLRLYALTADPRHLKFAQYLLSERGVKREDQEGTSYFVWEAKQRNDPYHAASMRDLDDLSYYSAHLPLHAQQDILGHSVRTFYLLTACADLGGAFEDDARRLLDDCVDHKMYVTGGVGTEPSIEGFSKVKYWLPQSTGEGGCYAETCAAIACMMCCERLLSHRLEGRVRDTLERCLLNAVLGGGSLNGKQFSYANKHATYGDEVATRSDWFTVCCCPPNLSRTLGLLGGYTWTVNVDSSAKKINLTTYLYVAATRTVSLPGGAEAKVTMKTEMPWKGKTTISVEAPKGWTWDVKLPSPEYAEGFKTSTKSESIVPGFVGTTLEASATVDITFDLPVRILASHPASGHDTLTVTKGPIIYTAESIDNAELEKEYTHFEGLGLSSQSQFNESPMTVEGIDVIALTSRAGDVYALEEFKSKEAFRIVGKESARTWKKLNDKLVLVPWFARTNRGGAAHLRTSFMRVD